MVKSNDGMGMKKHGRSGYAPKSPKMRHAMKREAEKQEIKPKKSSCVYTSVSEALDKEGL